MNVFESLKNSNEKVKKNADNRPTILFLISQPISATRNIVNVDKAAPNKNRVTNSIVYGLYPPHKDTTPSNIISNGANAGSPLTTDQL